MAKAPERLTWQAWLKLWNQPDLPYELDASLIRWAFKLSVSGLTASEQERQKAERICLMLETASRHYLSPRRWDLHIPSSQPDYGPARCELAELAFEQVCQHVFRPRGIMHVEELIDNPEVWERLLQFFNADNEDVDFEILGLSGGTDTQYGLQARAFAESLCLAGLQKQWKTGDVTKDRRAASLRPKVIGILIALGLLYDVIIRRGYAQYLDARCKRYLMSIAMRPRMWATPGGEPTDGITRRPSSVLEVITDGGFAKQDREAARVVRALQDMSLMA